VEGEKENRSKKVLRSSIVEDPIGRLFKANINKLLLSALW